MAKNHGKQFEDVIKKAFEKVEGVSIDRLRDAPKKLKNVDNPSDFIVYKKPHEVYVECKSHRGNTFPFSCIREEQWNGLLEKSKITGVKAGVMLWFTERDTTVWIDIQTLAGWSVLHKSIHIDDLDNIHHITISGRKKRVYFDYDMKKFLEDLYGN